MCCQCQWAVRKNSIFVLLRTALKDSPQGPPTANRHQPPPTANCQPPSAANRHQPQTIVQHRFCGVVSCPCLDHEAESVPSTFVSVGVANPRDAQCLGGNARRRCTLYGRAPSFCVPIGSSGCPPPPPSRKSGSAAGSCSDGVFDSVGFHAPICLVPLSRSSLKSCAFGVGAIQWLRGVVVLNRVSLPEVPPTPALSSPELDCTPPPPPPSNPHRLGTDFVSGAGTFGYKCH